MNLHEVNLSELRIVTRIFSELRVVTYVLSDYVVRLNELRSHLTDYVVRLNCELRS